MIFEQVQEKLSLSGSEDLLVKHPEYLVLVVDGIIFTTSDVADQSLYFNSLVGISQLVKKCSALGVTEALVQASDCQRESTEIHRFVPDL